MVVVRLVFLLACAQLSACILCKNSSGVVDWICAADHPEWTPPMTVVSGSGTDSCYCVNYAVQTQADAYASCVAIGGFLTDIKNAQENSLVQILIQNASEPAVPVSTVNAMPTCPNGTFTNPKNNMCYYYSTPKMQKSWSAAETYCKSTYKGHLASIDDLDEQNYINNITGNCTGCDEFGHWVGGCNNRNPNNWTWCGDGKLMQNPPPLRLGVNKAWVKAQPDDPVNQNCMVLIGIPKTYNAANVPGGWADWLCGWSQPFVCKFAPSVPITTTPAPAPITPAWIGLEKTVSGKFWNIGGMNCAMTLLPSSYNNIDTTTEASTKSAYAFQPTTGKWSNELSATTYPTAVCRKDRNACGRKPCPSSSTCSASTTSPGCYTCA